MKRAVAILALALLRPACASVLGGAETERAIASLKDGKKFPGGPAGAVTAVTQLMRDWSASLEATAKNELSGYDKYACWCEDTLARKAADIANAKEQIDSLQKLIEKLAGEVASHDAEIAHLEKLIAQNKQEQQEATEVRGNENGEFEGEKQEGEQCIGALEAAITALSGAGEGKFLQTTKEAQVLSVAGGVRMVLKKVSPSRRVSAEDLELAREFFESPLSRARKGGSSSLLAVNHNPFGDYAPQSTRIQGVLKSLYDTFAMELEKGNVEEAEAQKSYEELMKTKKAEQATLEATLEHQMASSAAKKKESAESKSLRRDVKEQLKADEAFFATSKDACKDKAKVWGERVRMRTQELQGIAKAIEILTDPTSTEIFANSSSQFVQLASTVTDVKPKNQKSFVALQTLAKSSGSKSLLRILQKAKEGGYFDKVMGEIDEMIALLRREEKMDIAHRDRCQNAENGNSNRKDELTNNINKADADIKRMDHEQSKTSTDISNLESEIEKTEADMETALAMRNKESKSFIQSVKDDTAAIAVLERALEALVAFYKRNKIPMLVQKKKGGPREYSVDGDDAPETSFDEGGYTGSKSENEGVVAIMSMIIEDVKKEIAESREDDAEAQAFYEKDRSAMEASHLKQIQTKAAMESRLQELDAEILDTQDLKDAKQDDLGVQDELTKTLSNDCSWVQTHFDSRKMNRKKELDGLVSAKAYLGGVADGTMLPP